MLSLCVLAVNMESEIANLFPRAPFQQYSATSHRVRLERSQLHRSRRLNCRDRG